jgi:hypothetical protein
MNIPTLDRAALLKGGGTAALAALIAGALDGRADACCSPIDLIFTDDPVAMTTTKPRRRAQAVKGVRIWSGNSNPPGAPWQALFSIPNAHIDGKDENGKSHGRNGGNEPQPLGYTITVYVSY